jgi:hypothetical protein
MQVFTLFCCLTSFLGAWQSCTGRQWITSTVAVTDYLLFTRQILCQIAVQACSFFDHIAYFRFDRNHPSNCNTCHLKAYDFSEYTCYGCHEHTQPRIAAEHLEEGIHEWENCAKCHLTGDADDVERTWKDEGRWGQAANTLSGKAKRGRDED